MSRLAGGAVAKGGCRVPTGAGRQEGNHHSGAGYYYGSFGCAMR
jgi:hypothetical protein